MRKHTPEEAAASLPTAPIWHTLFYTMTDIHDSELKLCGEAAGMLSHETVRSAVMRVVAERDRYRAAIASCRDVLSAINNSQVMDDAVHRRIKDTLDLTKP